MPMLSAIGCPSAAESRGPSYLLLYERVGCTFNSCRPRSPNGVGSFVPLPEVAIAAK